MNWQVEQYKKKTLIIIYRSFNVGGIETCMSNVMSNALDNGNRVIWICHKDVKYSKVFSKIIEHPQCEYLPVNFSAINPLVLPKIKIDNEEEVVIAVFDIKGLYTAYKVRKQYLNNCIKIFYMVPLFTGSTIFPDQSFRGIAKNVVNSIYRRIYDRTYKLGSLHFFSAAFYRAIQENYNIRFDNPDKKLFPNVKKRLKFDEDLVRRVYCSNDFTIISAGRFDFPHKAYLLGLIKSFSNLKTRHNRLKLFIIGSGPDKKRVYDAIEQCPLEVRNSITVADPVTDDELIEKMRTCNLNISVAGCANIGAKNGVPTLPARHYYEECEVYGFFPKSKLMTTETIPGEPVEPYIEQVLNMGEDEYVQLAKDAYNSYDDSEANINYPFDHECDTSFVPKRKEFWAFQCVYFFQRLFRLTNMAFKRND